MKTILLLLTIVFAVACNSPRMDITDQLFLYQDSLGKARAQLGVLQADIILNDSTDALTLFRKETYQLKKRQEIKNRIYTYQWKIDSLNMCMKAYNH